MDIDHNNTIVSYNKICSNIWLGNYAASQSKQIIDSMDVVINATHHIPFLNTNKICIRVPVNDPGPSDNMNLENTIMFEYLPKVCELIKLYRIQGKKIFVHCHAGAQRSASIVSAYLMKYGVWRISPDEKYAEITKLRSAIYYVIQKREIAFFGGQSVNFMPSLLQFAQL